MDGAYAKGRFLQRISKSLGNSYRNRGGSLHYDHIILKGTLDTKITYLPTIPAGWIYGRMLWGFHVNRNPTELGKQLENLLHQDW
jgi:hypothetical protein